MAKLQDKKKKVAERMGKVVPPLGAPYKEPKRKNDHFSGQAEAYKRFHGK